MDALCFNCGRIILGNPAQFTIFMPLKNELISGGHVCDRCVASIGQEIRLYALSAAGQGRGYGLMGSARL